MEHVELVDLNHDWLTIMPCFLQTVQLRRDHVLRLTVKR